MTSDDHDGLLYTQRALTLPHRPFTCRFFSPQTGREQDRQPAWLVGARHERQGSVGYHHHHLVVDLLLLAS